MIVECCVRPTGIPEEYRPGVAVIIGDGVRRGIVIRVLLGGDKIDDDEGS